MLSPSNVIQAINKSIEPFFIKGDGGRLCLVSYKSTNTYRLRVSSDCSEAYDDYGNSGNTVKVVKWFSDYWLFVEISFLTPRGMIITISVFQGVETDNFKNQLFRAEWDDYEDDNMNHPQPHWHFTSNKSIENTVNSFVEIAEMKDTFNELLNEEKRKVINIDKFHFAMNGDWQNTSSYIHPITDETALAKWFGGLLAYLKNELEYIDSRRRK